MNFDIIGDIHGHAQALTSLLISMGYRQRGGAWRHHDRKAVFVGDFIDRGPKQIETVNIVRRMVDAGSARAVMGNHEFNAIAWFTPDPDLPGEYLRPHHSQKYGEKNYAQHAAFLNEVNGTALHKEIIDWFMTLPLWLELDGIRVTHACWHTMHMNYIEPLLAEGDRLTPDLLIQASREPLDESEKDTAKPSIFKAVEAITKGIEVQLPPPHTFSDKDGIQRNRVRVRWWDKQAVSYRQAAMLHDSARRELPSEPIPSHAFLHYESPVPLFIGHYWLNETPTLLSDTVACVDYSVAKGGKLVAYRWDGEDVLNAAKFHWVGV